VAVTPGTGKPRFPGYDVTAQSHTWDGVTTAVVLGRLGARGAAAFFTAEEEPTARALVNRLLAQDSEPRIPVFEIIDQRLAERRGDGYRYKDLPDDPDAWRRSITGLETTAQAQFGLPFSSAPLTHQRDIIEEVRLCRGQWQGLPAERLFSLWMRYACSAFYSHPWAWNEIGFGGPAYPRGYKRLALDGREPWEVAERDATDPVPWVTRAEAAKRNHAEGLSTGHSTLGSRSQ
jgi:Gluconate 2-dehydrogenase subunit 3